MTLNLKDLVSQNTAFYLYLDGKIVSRAEDERLLTREEAEDESDLPFGAYPILKDVSHGRAWTVEVVDSEVSPDPGAPLVCRLRCGGALVGEHENRVCAFVHPDEIDVTDDIYKWILQSGQGADATKFSITMFSCPLMWGHSAPFGIQEILLMGNLNPQYHFTLEPVPTREQILEAFERDRKETESDILT